MKGFESVGDILTRHMLTDMEFEEYVRRNGCLSQGQFVVMDEYRSYLTGASMSNGLFRIKSTDGLYAYFGCGHGIALRILRLAKPEEIKARRRL